MKKFIRIKIKHLIFIPIFLFVIFPNLLYFSAKTIFNNDGYIGGNLARDYSYGLLKLYSVWPKIPSYKGEADYMMGKCIYSTATKNKNRYIKDNSSPKAFVTGNSIPNDLLVRGEDEYNLAINYFENSLHNLNEGEYYGRTIIALCNLYLDRGNAGKALDLINNGLNHNDEKVRLASTISNISFLIRTGDKLKALNIAKDLKEKYNYNITNNIYIDMLYANDIFDEIRQIFKSTNNDLDISTQSNNEKLITTYYKEVDTLKASGFNSYRNEHYKINVGGTIIEGRMTYGGNPIPNALVGLNFYDNGNSSGEFVKATYTDKDGYYKFTNIPNNKYSITVNTPLYILDNWVPSYINTGNQNSEVIIIEIDSNKVIYNIDLKERVKLQNNNGEKLTGDFYTLKWSEVEGAASYKIRISVDGGEYNNYGKNGIGYLEDYTNIKDTEFKLPLVNGSIMSIPYYDTYIESPKKKGINYIGFVDGRDIKVHVIPVDDSGKEIQNAFYEHYLMSAITLTPSKLKLNKGDSLMKAGKIEEAIDWYKNSILTEGYKKEYIYPLLKSLCINSITTSEDNKNFNILLSELYKINGNDQEIELYKSVYERGIYKNTNEAENK